MPWKNIIILCVAMLTSVPDGISSDNSPELHLRNSAVTKLLHEKSITCIERDNTGFLWICTLQGLYKYNGNEITKFSPLNDEKHWINSHNVKQLILGSHGEIFIATRGGGISKYNSVKESFYPIDREQNSTKYLDVETLVDTPEHLWFTTLDSGIGSYRKSTGEFETWLPKNRINAAVRSPSDIVALGNGEIWFGAESGLYRIQPKIEQIDVFELPHSKEFGPSALRVQALLEVSNQRFAVGAKSGHLSYFDILSRRFVQNSELYNMRFNSINNLQVFKGKIWIATELGLVSWDETNDEITEYLQQNSNLSNNQVKRLKKDGDRLWIGTYLGLDIAFASSFELLNTLNSRVDNDVMAFAEDSSDRLWVSTYNGVYYQKKGSKSHLPIQSLHPNIELEDRRIMSSAVKGNDLWLGFREDGLQIVDLTDGTSTKPIKNVGITKILHTSDDETWIGTHRSGLFLFKGKILVTKYDQSSAPGSKYLGMTVTSLFKAKSGTLFIGTENGLLTYDPGRKYFSEVRISQETATSEPVIFSIVQDRENAIWVGTLSQGLFKSTEFLSNTATGFDSIIPNITAYSMVIDDGGYPWISTTQGLLKLDDAGRIIGKYTAAHGLQDNDFNFGASFKDSKGRLYFGGSKGYNRFEPQLIDTNSIPPPVVLTGLRIAGSQIKLPAALHSLEKFQLSHNDYFFTISFSALDFLEPSKNRYSYKLENFDAKWIDNGTSNSATYTNLPPGDYTFRVRGANSAGVWNLEGAYIDVEVLPAPWFSWWAWVCYTFAGMTAVFYGKKIYDDRLIAKEVALRAKQMQHSADRASDDLQDRLEIQDELVRSVYKHNLDTLNLVKNLNSVRAEFLSDPAEVNSFEKDQQRLAALSYLESCVLYQDEILYADLKKYTDMAIDLTLKTSLIPVESITTINDVSSKMVPVELATAVAVVIFELLDNCVSHAFVSGSPANYIQISLDSQFNTSSQSHQLSLVVKDDGVGFSADIPNEELESTGIAFVRSVIDKFHGELTVSNANPGTRVEVLFPNTLELIAPYGNRS